MGIVAPVIEPSTNSARLRAGTSAMFVGTVVSALGAIAFQVVGGRALGADDFAPVSVMWTQLFLGFTIFLLPVEQVVIRRRVLGGAGPFAGAAGTVVAVVGAATLCSVGFSLLAAEPMLRGDRSYAWVAAAMFVSHGVFAVARGQLAGQHRFVAYGVAVGLDAVAKLAGAVVVTTVGGGPLALSSALAVAPVVVFLLRPFRGAGRSDGVGESDARFLVGYLIASAASQTVLAGGPLIVGVLGAPGATISIFFVTTTLFRGPLSASYNLIARILPVATLRSAEGQDELLDRWIRLLWIVGLAGSALGGVVAGLVGPGVVALLFGPEFRPEWWLTALAASAVVFGMAGLVITQVLVARYRADRMAQVWLVALLAATVAVVVTPGVASLRVGVAFLVGEFAAFVGLTIAAFER